jgi:hypothetical protein
MFLFQKCHSWPGKNFLISALRRMAVESERFASHPPVPLTGPLAECDGAREATDGLSPPGSKSRPFA